MQKQKNKFDKCLLQPPSSSLLNFWNLLLVKLDIHLCFNCWLCLENVINFSSKPYPHFHTHKTKFSTMSNRKSLKTFLTWKMYAIFSIPVEFGVYCVVIIKPIHIIENLEQFLRTIKFEFPHMAQYGDPSRGKLLLKNNFQYFSVLFS